MEDLIKDWGYIILFLYSFGGGMLALGIAGALSFSGELNIYISIIVAITANAIGDQFLFLMAKNNQEKAKQMIGKYQNLINKSENIMTRFGSLAIFLQKYIYGIKTLIPLIMGLTTYSAKRFLVYNILASIVWGVVIGFTGFYLSEAIRSIASDAQTYGIALIVIIVLVVVYFTKIKKS